MIHETYFKIRTFHTDAFGHVNNSRHLELLEEARWQYAEQIGLLELLAERELGFIIMDMRLRFRAPVFEGDTTRVLTSLIALGSASGEVEQLVFKEGQEQVAVKSLFHFILIDRANGSSVPIESTIRDLLLSVIETPSTKKRRVTRVDGSAPTPQPKNSRAADAKQQ
jgi:thioesterase-3